MGGRPAATPRLRATKTALPPDTPRPFRAGAWGVSARFRRGRNRPRGSIGSPELIGPTPRPTEWPAGWTDWRTRRVLPARRRRPVAVRIGRRVPQTHARNRRRFSGMDRRRRLPYGSAGRRHRLGPPPNRFSRPPVSTTTPYGLPARRQIVCFRSPRSTAPDRGVTMERKPVSPLARSVGPRAGGSLPGVPFRCGRNSVYARGRSVGRGSGAVRPGVPFRNRRRAAGAARARPRRGDRTPGQRPARSAFHRRIFAVTMAPGARSASSRVCSHTFP